jgi:hypothetical protein
MRISFRITQCLRSALSEKSGKKADEKLTALLELEVAIRTCGDCA